MPFNEFRDWCQYLDRKSGDIETQRAISMLGYHVMAALAAEADRDKISPRLITHRAIEPTIDGADTPKIVKPLEALFSDN